MEKILVIDDDSEILKLIRNVLGMKNYEVEVRSEVTLPINVTDFQGFDLIMLDIMLTNITGLEICQAIRDSITTPIIFVSAKDSEDDIVNGLGLGGDDYITKPFSIKQLVAKVEAHLKREIRSRESQHIFHEVKREFGSLTFDLEAKKVYISGSEISLTSREYAILELISSNPKKVFTREEIYDAVYGLESDTLSRSISEYIYQIRQKFSNNNYDPIRTVRGIGYQWHE